jgi:arylsulfatase A-like enzyme
MIVRWPGVVEPGTASDAVCNLMDIGPTFAEIAGTSFPYAVAGRSMLKILREGEDERWVDETTSELADFRGGFLPSKMIRSGPWKLWVYGDYPEMPPALYNLEDDPDEQNDLGEDPDYEDIRSNLIRRLFEGWDPGNVLEKSKKNVEYFEIWRKWGQATDPDSPDALVYPSDEYESDVELI